MTYKGKWGRATQGKEGEGRAAQERAGQGTAGQGRARQVKAGQRRAWEGRARKAREGQGTVGQELLYLKAGKCIATLIISHLHLTIALLSNGCKEQPLGVHMGRPHLHSTRQVLHGSVQPCKTEAHWLA